MPRTHKTEPGRRQSARARREVAWAIKHAATPSLRDELIIIAQRSDLY